MAARITHPFENSRWLPAVFENGERLKPLVRPDRTLLDAIRRPFVPELILEDQVLIFIPAGLAMPEPADEPSWFGTMTDDGRTHRQRAADLIANIDHVHAGRVPIHGLDNGDEGPRIRASIDNYVVAWVTRAFGDLFLIGEISNHPASIGGNGRLHSTSTLAAISLDGTWALTMSGFYQLGTYKGDR